MCISKRGMADVFIVDNSSHILSADEIDWTGKFLYGCKFGFVLTIVAMVFNVIQIGLQISRKCEILFNLMACSLSMIFFIFLIICCTFAYSKTA